MWANLRGEIVLDPERVREDRDSKTATNRDVVPYNPFLLVKYRCHINVEAVRKMELSYKYIYKYMTKGSDQTVVECKEKLLKKAK